MKEIFVEDKQKFLDENYPFEEAPKLTDKRCCLHCHRVFTVGDYKIYKEEGDDFLYIYCPYTPDCNGTVIDWLPEDAKFD